MRVETAMMLCFALFMNINMLTGSAYIYRRFFYLKEVGVYGYSKCF